MLLKIPRLYDSHTHFLATGEWSLGLKLGNLLEPEDVQHIQLQPAYYRADWLVGSGFNPATWTSQANLKSILDQYFPQTPVSFVRLDGHSSWWNSRAHHLHVFQV
jgi:predicted amidohydrolase YtcJ